MTQQTLPGVEEPVVPPPSIDFVQITLHDRYNSPYVLTLTPEQTKQLHYMTKQCQSLWS